MSKFLLNYPFSDPTIRLVEGFAAYNGVLGDEAGAPHKGIDYVKQVGDAFVSFDVFTMHAGAAYRGASESWGTFVGVRVIVDEVVYDTIYAHLDHVDETLPLLDQENSKALQRKLIEAGSWLGIAGTTGKTNGIIQLHLELHRKDRDPDDETKSLHTKLDPYGVNDRASSGRYPQPGASLVGLSHFFTTDLPPFAPPR